ncbi:hypothetical protein TPHA_0B04130 [Tetrapisispora phaffii CBS 4417]|uniref:Mitochondrial dicarboxylate transporter n=1 Tax=Tetrapisispora phaffii (strain ATCC 24235 / CBS 4417 / NBRC 1672 / NRRL Y-8282 / UCD 70-5) TaxID=1071381 RepID=G8BQ02_TETPH|nr:hypothetical protein TPHA_0B04130 [Tetrapisispora phaffii CBS 4417]CCE62083.1 hypothetical protein TPHA_0B04130 [Tetrapisispora phaffii CBS 4417]
MPEKYPWWYGGCGGLVATFCTHPLDLTKVRLQTAPLGVDGRKPNMLRMMASVDGRKPNMLRMMASVFRNEGLVGLYSGLSAAVLRQCTYTTARFGCYDLLKEHVIPQNQLNNIWYLLPSSMLSGAIGGLVGNPADVVNIRMQNDTSLPVAKRRNYRNALDGLYRIVLVEQNGGVRRLYAGWQPNLMRGVLMTASQVVTYDLFKNYLVSTLHMAPSEKKTHFTASLMAGLVATTVCSPADVMKTRIMNSHKHHEPVLASLLAEIRNEGIGFIFRGWVPSFVRLAPFTVLIFLTVEQLKKHRVGMPSRDTATTAPTTD